MLQVPFIRQNRERVLESLAKRNFANTGILDEILDLDERRRATQTELDALLAESNKIAKDIPLLFKSGQADQVEPMKQRAAELKEQAVQLKKNADEVATQLEDALLQVPNCLSTAVPFGKSADDNEVYKDWTTDFPALPENALPHWDIAKKCDIVDFELGVKLTGAGFPVYKGKGAKLQRALISFFLDEAEAAGYYEIQPPLMVNAESARATGQLPDKEGQMYYMPVDDFYMIPTAEVPVTNLYRDVILNEADFPIKMCGYTPCFRREAGAYGAHVRGLNRLHQFDKVEIVHLEHPSRSYDTLMQMLAHVEGLLDKLGLPYRILRLCGGDTGFASAMTFDFEAYSTAQQRWLEVSSVSNFETFQSNRMKLRFKNAEGKTELAHTLNGSALALPRIVASLLENYQTPEGVRIPEALQPYTKFDFIPYGA